MPEKERNQHSEYSEHYVSVHSKNPPKKENHWTHSSGSFFKWYQKLMGNLKVHQKGHGCLVKELRFPVFILYVGQRFVKVVYDKNKTIRKRLNIIKNQSIPTT